MAKVSVVAGDPHERQRDSGWPGPVLSPTQSRAAGDTSTAPALGGGTSLGLGTSPEPMDGLSLVGPRAGWGRAVEAADLPWIGMAGAGGDGHRGLTCSPGPSRHGTENTQIVVQV